MGVIVISPTLGEFPQTVRHPIIEIKQNWSDDWIWVPEIRLRSMSSASAGHDLSRLVLLRPYGPTKHPWESDFPGAIDTAVDLTDWWVRVRALTGTARDLATAWLGRFSDEDRDLFASSQGLSGMQVWVAYGPAQILRKRFISKSYWLTNGGRKHIGWVPPLNDPTKSERGNRHNATSEGVHLYGGTDLWDYRQYAEYLLKNFLDESDDNGPSWKLAGAAEVLEEIKEPITWGTTQSAAEMLLELIPVSRGLDYTIRLILDEDGEETGFEVFVYALSAQEFSFGGSTLPANPDTVRIEVGEANNNDSTRVIVSRNRYYKKLRVLGKRIVVCCSLWGPMAVERSGANSEMIGVPVDATLDPKWLDTIETEYRASVGGDSEDEADHDRFRNQDKFRSVYQSYGAVDGWEWNEGTAAPALDDEGLLITEAPVEDPGDPILDDTRIADHQHTVRETLSWIPLLAGLDYTGLRDSSPLPEVPPGDESPDYIPLIAWMFDPYTYRYVVSEELDIGVNAKHHDWGVELQCSPNHLVADTHFDDAVETYITATWPRYDHEEMAVTIAMESDQRFAMESVVDGATDQDGVFEIETEAEFHYLAPNTIVGASKLHDDPLGLLILSGSVGIVLRSDKELMELTMAAAISRYQSDRKRAQLQIRGFIPWQFLIGRVLTTLEEAGETHVIDGPITSITWQVPDDGGSPITILSAGFAQ